MAMTDIHCHLLFNVDDGAKTIDESIEIIKDMYEYGYKNIIITPHYISNSKYSSKKSDNLNNLNEIKRKLKENNILMNIYLGNEIYMDYDILDLLKEGIVSSLNNSHYLLIELPMSGVFNGYIDVFTELMNYGYKIILAHPERYYDFQDNFDRIYELDRIGVLFQSNLDSIIGGYGKNAKRMMKRLLKERLISFLASDIHHKKHDYTKWDKARKKALKYLTIDEYNKLVNDNPLKVLNDENLSNNS